MGRLGTIRHKVVLKVTPTNNPLNAQQTQQNQGVQTIAAFVTGPDLFTGSVTADWDCRQKQPIKGNGHWAISLK